MISVLEASEAILGAVPTLGVEEVPFDQAHGRVLRAPIVADRDLPPFDRVMMDGIALHSSGLDGGNRRFAVAGLQAAGEPRATLERPSMCLEVMTGSVLPNACDSIVPYECITIEDGVAVLAEDFEVCPFRFVHRQGSDYLQGTELVADGTRISPNELAVAASCGCSSLLVSRLPRIAVVSTGNELVGVGEAVAPHQIRRSNVHALAAAVQASGYPPPDLFHLMDDREAIEERLGVMVEEYDILILSGGVSKGKLDFIPHVLSGLHVKKYFHRVKQMPGKPFWFGQKEGGATVFALPGNPVSTLVCFQRYVKPALVAMSGLQQCPTEWITLLEGYQAKPDLTCFIPVFRRNVEGSLGAIPRPNNNSGDYASLVYTDGFVELSDDDGPDFVKGSLVPYCSWY